MATTPLTKEEACVRYKTFTDINAFLAVKSRYRLPYSLIYLKANFKQVLDYLQEEKILDSYRYGFTRNDVLPMATWRTVYEREECTGHGISYTNPHIALSKAIGEGLERLALNYPGAVKSKATLKKYRRDNELLKSLDLFPTFLSEQTALFSDLYDVSKHKDVEFETVECHSLMSKKKVTLPAQYIFWRYKAPAEPQLLSQTTNGAGAHFTEEEAIISGLNEEIQRDTFLLYWLSKKTPLKVDLSSITSSTSREMIERMKQKGIDVHVLYLENEYNLPVFICLLFDKRAPLPVLCIGAGNNAGLYESAIEAAIYEAISVITVTLLYEKPRYTLGKDFKPFFDRTISRDERITMWAGEWIENAISFFISGKEISLASIVQNECVYATQKEALGMMLDRLQKGGIGEVVVYPVVSPILKAIGYHVVRVVVPEFLQLYLREYQATLQSARLAKYLKKDVRTLSLTDINPLPHPFP